MGRKLIPADLFDSPRDPYPSSGPRASKVLMTIKPTALLKLEQMGWISSRWGTSESGRRVRIYAVTRAGRQQLHKEEAQWRRAASIVERFLKISESPS